MKATTYTNCIGTFTFDDKKIAEEKLLDKKEIVKNNAKIKQEVPPLYVLEALAQPKYLKLMREATILITKRKVAESLRPEYLIIQTVNNVDEIDKVVNNLAKRLREWYELYNPEFSKSIEAHEKFSEMIQKKTRKELLAELGMTEAESMGADIPKEDMKPILDLAEQISELYALRARHAEYIEKTMTKLMPNVTAMCGSMIGAKLLAVAGSLEKLALFPASTIQLLGAEKALFRHMKTGAKPPKFGIIINHPIVARTKPADKGKSARMLADKISIAAKIDFFKGEFRGDALRKEVEEKFK
jgi:nucleolar protein 56